MQTPYTLLVFASKWLQMQFFWKNSQFSVPFSAKSKSVRWTFYIMNRCVDIRTKKYQLIKEKKIPINHAHNTLSRFLLLLRLMFIHLSFLSRWKSLIVQNYVYYYSQYHLRLKRVLLCLKYKLTFHFWWLFSFTYVS